MNLRITNGKQNDPESFLLHGRPTLAKAFLRGSPIYESPILWHRIGVLFSYPVAKIKRRTPARGMWVARKGPRESGKPVLIEALHQFGFVWKITGLKLALPTEPSLSLCWIRDTDEGRGSFLRWRRSFYRLVHHLLNELCCSFFSPIFPFRKTAFARNVINSVTICAEKFVRNNSFNNCFTDWTPKVHFQSVNHRLCRSTIRHTCWLIWWIESFSP